MPEKTILIVEDDADIRNDLRKLLMSEGYAVMCANNGQMALDMLASELRPPSLILLDLMMPVMDGWKFRAAQNQAPTLATVPVVVMTADGHADQKAQKLAAQGFIQKPIDLKVLLETIATYAARS